MTQRPGKAAVIEDSPERRERTHLQEHLHLTNYIHLKNHLHLQSHSLMLDARRPLQLPLMREATHLQKIRTFHDPSTSSSESDSRSGGSAGGDGARKGRTFIGDPHKDAQALAVELSAKLVIPAKLSNWGDGGIRLEMPQSRVGEKKTMAVVADDEARHGNGDVKKSVEANGRELDASDDAVAAPAALKVDVKERIKRIESVFEGLAPVAAPQTGQEREGAGDLTKESIIKELKERGRKEAAKKDVDEVRSDERWQGDAGRREELAQRVIAENNGSPSSLSQLLSNPRGSARNALTLLGMADHQSDAGESLFQSDEGELSPMEREMTATTRPPTFDPESPLTHKDSSRSGRERRTPQSSGGRKKSNSARSKEGINLRRARGRKAARPHSAGYKEAPASASDGDELDVSELPPNGCGMPWDWSRIHRYRGRAFMDLAAGMACTYPETMRRNSDATEVAPPVQSISSLDSDAHALPLITGDDTHDSDLAGFYIEPGIAAPAREIPQQFAARRRSLEKASKTPPADTAAVAAAASRSTREIATDLGHRTLSQKYRPKSFHELVGQTMVVRSLATAVAKGKVAPVYLFMGPRGTGKTSAARIFAAGLNCLSSEPARRPCGICRECGTMSLNRSADMKEIDAASNADVASMHAVMGNFVPQARYKVFIVDGCDLLGADIWSAFLKVLEEPPRNVVFILITTDADRIPLTAMSRCQKFAFSKVKESDIVGRLQTLADKEDLDVEDGALSLIASRSDGSVRDAEITLDQLGLLDKRVSLALVQELVGLLPDGKLLDLLDSALSADTVTTVRTMREVLSAGVEPLALVSQLGALITDILVGSFDVQRETRRTGFFNRNFSTKQEQQRLRQALKILSESEKQLRGSSDRSTWLTAALLQFAPDRSFLPSSVNTSVAHSPVHAPRNPAPAAESTMPLPDNTERMESGRTQEDPRREVFSEADAGFAPGEAATLSERKLEAAWARGQPQQGAAYGPLAEGPPAGESEEFQVLGDQASIELWNRVVREVTSKNLKHLLQTQGRLVAAAVACDGASAIVEVEFQHARDKQKAERSWRSICTAFQAVLATAVELRITLIENPFDAAAATLNMGDDDDASRPSTHQPPHTDPRRLQEELAAALAGVPLAGHRRRSKPRRHHRPAPEIEVQHGSEAGGDVPPRGRRGVRRRGHPAAGPPGEASRSESSWARTAAEQYSGSWGGETWDSGSLAGGSTGGPPTRPPPGDLKGQATKVPSGGRESGSEERRKKATKKAKVVQFRSGSGLAKTIEHSEHEDLIAEPPRRSATEGILCWKEPATGPEAHTRNARVQGRQRGARGKALFLKLVPCTKSNATRTAHGAPPTTPGDRK